MAVDRSLAVLWFHSKGKLTMEDGTFLLPVVLVKLFFPRLKHLAGFMLQKPVIFHISETEPLYMLYSGM